MVPYTRVYAKIDLDAAVSNMRAMRANIPASTGMFAVVKADGYGHGAVPIARAIDAYAAGYAVATPEEAVQLRTHGIEKQILILGAVHPADFETLIKYDIRPAMFDLEQAEILSSLALQEGKKAAVHLALDTGMSRIGLACTGEGLNEAIRICALPGLKVEGLFTHFARADERDKGAYEAQYSAYKGFLAGLYAAGIKIPVRHCSNSAAIIDGLSSNELDMVRAGISIYGIYPSDEVNRAAVRLTPVMALKTTFTRIRAIEAGVCVGYGGTFTAQQKTLVATVPVGYADGYPRGLSGKGSVLVRGQRAAILGRICMDQFMVDVTGIEGASVGDEVTLLGRDGQDEIGVEELSALCGRFPYEFVCDISKRVPRVYYKAGKVVGTKDYDEDRFGLF